MHALVGRLALGLWQATAPAQATEPAPAQATEPAPASAQATEPAPAPTPEPSRPSLFSRLAGRKNATTHERVPPTGPPPEGRRFMVGLEGVVFSAPPLKSTVLLVDPRFVGRSVALGGVGLFGRYRPISVIAVDVGVRSGSVRYNNREGNTSVSQDQIAADAAVLVYLARGHVAQFALSGGLGGMWNRIGYEINDRSARQTFGSLLFRVGGEAEFLLKRVAFTISFRNYAFWTPRSRVNNRGLTGDPLAPVSSFQSALMGAIGIAFRF